MAARRRVRKRNMTGMAVCPAPDDVSLADVASRCRYVSSPYHRTRPLGGVSPVYMPGKSKCPKHLQEKDTPIQQWLREAILAGNCGKFDAGFPRRVWKRVGDTIFEAQHGAPGSGEYHAYPLDPCEVVRGLK